MLKFFISCLYFFLPAYFANMVPPLVKRIKLFEFLGEPVDFGKKFLKKPIFGSHKTWRGVMFSFLVGSLTVILQISFYQFEFFKEISLFNYSSREAFILIVLFPLGQILGDLSFSFIKRRIGLKPGAPFLPFDQTNYVIGCFVLLQPILKLNLKVWIFLFFFTFPLHILINRLGYELKIHSAKW